MVAQALGVFTGRTVDQWSCFFGVSSILLVAID
jgi:hypothetical protein